MHPAYSVIWFTTMSGAGYGLAAYLGLGVAQIEGWMAFISYGMAIALISIGLLSSTLHLGHPERAWRAFSPMALKLVIARRCIGYRNLCAIVDLRDCGYLFQP